MSPKEVARSLPAVLTELADELDMELGGGAKWTKAQHTCASVAGALRDSARIAAELVAALNAMLTHMGMDEGRVEQADVRSGPDSGSKGHRKCR
jgi:hypothetical protein